MVFIKESKLYYQPKRELLYTLVFCFTESIQLISAIYYVSTAVAIHSHVSSVALFDGVNFLELHEQVDFHLGAMDLDLAQLEDKPTAITDSSGEEKS